MQKKRLITAKKTNNKNFFVAALIEMKRQESDTESVCMELIDLLKDDEELLEKVILLSEEKYVVTCAIYELKAAEKIYQILSTNKKLRCHVDKCELLFEQLAELNRHDLILQYLKEFYSDIWSNKCDSFYEFYSWDVEHKKRNLFYCIINLLKNNEECIKEVVLWSSDLELKQELVNFIKSEEIFRELLEKSNDWYIRAYSENILERIEQKRMKKNRFIDNSTFSFRYLFAKLIGKVN